MSIKLQAAALEVRGSSIFKKRRARMESLYDSRTFQILGYENKASHSLAEETVSIQFGNSLQLYSLPDSSWRESHTTNCQATMLQFHGHQGTVERAVSHPKWREKARNLLLKKEFTDFLGDYGGFWWDYVQSRGTKPTNSAALAAIPGISAADLGSTFNDMEVRDFIETVFAEMTSCAHLQVRKCAVCEMEFLPTGWTMLELHVGGQICPMCCHLATDWRQTKFWLSDEKEQRLVEIDLGLSLSLLHREALPISTAAPQWDSLNSLQEANLEGLNQVDTTSIFLAVALRPKLSQVRIDFESWESWVYSLPEIYDDVFPKRQRAYVASDGHHCFSKGELTLCEYLTKKGLAHSKEPPYADLAGNEEPLVRHFVGDFRVGETIIEFAGVQGNGDYEKRLADKLYYAKLIGIKVLVVEPDMLGNLDEVLCNLITENQLF